MCNHFPSPVIGYNWETDMFYCNICNEKFKVEDKESEEK